MSRTPEIVDFDLIHSWRQHGISFREIGWRLAMKRGRQSAFNANSIAHAYRRWLDGRGIRPDPDQVDLRHKRRG